MSLIDPSNCYSFCGFQVPQPTRTNWVAAALQMKPGFCAVVPSWDRARALHKQLTKLKYIADHRQYMMGSPLYLVWNLGDRRMPLNVCAACQMANCASCYVKPWNRRDRPCDCEHKMPFLVQGDGSIARCR